VAHCELALERGACSGCINVLGERSTSRVLVGGEVTRQMRCACLLLVIRKVPLFMLRLVVGILLRLRQAHWERYDAEVVQAVLLRRPFYRLALSD
jgi:hypothetical protein